MTSDTLTAYVSLTPVADAVPIERIQRKPDWKKPPPQHITSASLTKSNIGTVKRINQVVFPISYSAKFYDESLAADMEEFNRLVYCADIPVACICCRLEKMPGSDSAKLYIATMAVLAAYRSLTIGHQMLSLVLHAAAKHKSPKISSVYVHVQVSNEEARKFYEREGFTVISEVKDYYRKITPKEAWLMEREITPDDAVHKEDV
ncbi:acyl-CoA N-acyltransferase [Dacryopinax primogenitus]|uniref:Acyl-CoA N-acyltransferase n=1 Tax=Dacryopinax primogenitus (strain DJM 731) TaxID=1858805 RepID=M5G0D1_DACPD|nr:acyl-CoA N-acyltransferase [Dacryopinax primogenitus]EJT97257.1 acyl-CoA N-acyltransferase [Dacryopinax primogenitus]